MQWNKRNVKKQTITNTRKFYARYKKKPLKATEKKGIKKYEIEKSKKSRVRAHKKVNQDSYGKSFFAMMLAETKVV